MWVWVCLHAHAPETEALRKLDIEDPRELFAQGDPGKAPPVLLRTCYVAQSVLDTLEAALEEGLTSQGWLAARVRTRRWPEPLHPHSLTTGCTVPPRSPRGGDGVKHTHTHTEPCASSFL